MKFNIEIQWHYKAFDYATVEVEADTLEQAKIIALARQQSESESLPWLDGQIYEGVYSVNDDACEGVS